MKIRTITSKVWVRYLSGVSKDAEGSARSRQAKVFLVGELPCAGAQGEGLLGTLRMRDRAGVLEGE